MNVVFRTDATSRIGTGHFMRCMTLAEELQRHGAQICFVSRGLPQYLREMLESKGMELASLKSDTIPCSSGDLAHSHWLSASQEQDALATNQALSGREWDWLVVDHYALDVRWESAMRSLVKRIMVIDDLADRQHDCDLLLDQNYYTDMQSRYEGKTPAQCQLLLGPRYALLRAEFRELRKQVHLRIGQVKKILVFFGGADVDNYTGVAVQALSKLEIPGIQVDVVIGAQHPARKEIGKACAALGFHCHVQTSRMAVLMAEADLAIGAGGSATWERCCMGLPALSICLAENQRRQIGDAAEMGMLYGPTGDGDLADMIKRHTKCLVENTFLLKSISNAAMKMVDGDGSLRVVRELGCIEKGVETDSVCVRLATADDALFVWSWRNSEMTRRYFFDPTPVSLDKHVEWWNRSLADTQRVLLIGYLAGHAFGVVRFDFNCSESAVVSIYLDPNMTGKGMGRVLLFSGLSWLREKHPETRALFAEILPENFASLRAFQAVGFVEQYRTLVFKLRE